MIVSIIKGKAKDWEKQFKKEFGGLPSDATLEDVVKYKEKANEQKNSSSFKLKINSKSDQASSEKEKGDEQ
jgi:hypothetical protein